MAGRRILIAIDGSEHSERAFDWYCENIRLEDDVLVFSHTLELPPKPPTPFPYVEGFYENWKKEIELARTESRNMLAKYQYICEERNIEILNAVYDERYQPGPSICKVAEENNVSLIILGSRGLGKVRRTFLGSISDYVVHHAHLPVCVVPPADQDPQHNNLKEEKTRSRDARTPSPLQEQPKEQSKQAKPKSIKSKPETQPESKPKPEADSQLQGEEQETAPETTT
ncbi:uncharacterized protein LOC116307407 [Actinia tenebrosa]|uniref:Uncharacterized protein LOC116307407 n=1 Tax=Actinia tenebrosa TaxID=6105 RepID=A0A6P8J6K3_ACTTE|nr:uncharacterized protein LOC116307407 [Actinia tenebrosa]